MRNFLVIKLFLLLPLSSLWAEEIRDAAGIAFFEAKIRPVLVKECYSCHSSQSGNARGGLTLDTKERMAIGGTTGPAIIPGNTEDSLLLHAISYDDFEMPPNRKLSPSVIDDFRRWVEMGAPDPRSQQITKVQSSITTQDIEKAKSSFWAYLPPRHSKPTVKDHTQWSLGEIDRYILEGYKEAKVHPPADAKANEVLRRLTFDLVGLPPTAEQIQFFASQWEMNPSSAIAHVVERLLDSKHFGERWGRHWMDVVRYGESSGRAVNMTYPHAWRYRDYIIDSFNQDKPYDQFVQEQIAGDLLPADSDDVFAEHLVATSFLAIGSKNVNESNRVQFAADLVDEQIDATTRVFMGMSIACARCHDHKFDAIPQEDYYALAGIFQSTNTFFGNPQSELGHFSDATDKQNSTLLILPVDQPSPYASPVTVERLQEIRNQMAEERRQMLENRRTGQGNQPNSQRERIAYLKRMAEWSGILASVDPLGKPKSFCMGVQDAESPQDASFLVRGEIDQPLETIPRGFPSVLVDSQPVFSSQSSGRLELARWIGSDRNPLLARVMVNRIWMQLFGAGIVRSPDNFGQSGDHPTHPELLDYLALRFIESGWSVKTLIREIVKSRVYRISSDHNEEYHTSDPDNHLVWRANPRRLDAESIRDAMLCIGGNLQTNPPQASLIAAIGYTRVMGGRVLPTRTMMTALASLTNESENERVSNPSGFERDRIGMGNPFSNSNGFGYRRGRFRNSESPSAFFARSRRDGGFQLLDAEFAKYRSVYLPLARDAEPRALAVFDLADTSMITGKREVSNTANQSLYLMNNSFVQQQSRAFAERLAEGNSGLAEQVDYAVLLAYGRPATDEERETLTQFVSEYRSVNEDAGLGEILSVVCQSLFASAEFLILK